MARQRSSPCRAVAIILMVDARGAWTSADALATAIEAWGSLGWRGPPLRSGQSQRPRPARILAGAANAHPGNGW
eukprot:4009248-Alexandrium_andersonii.AAC.1